MTRAVLAPGGRYKAFAPTQVADAPTLLYALAEEAGPNGCVLAGFDFPIGLPRTYAAHAGVRRFLDLLPRLGRGDWRAFFEVAEDPAQIGLRRPFYPKRPGGALRRHLISGLSLSGSADLDRRCDQKTPTRGPACPMFWTIGGKQVGKAALSGWREMLVPAVRDPALDLVIWPFAGNLPDLIGPGRVVVVEAYPAECYGHLGVQFPRGRRGRKTGKRVRADRAANATTLLGWADSANVALEPALNSAIRLGFDLAAGGEDGFDATVGLFGMLNVLLGRRRLSEPADTIVREIEGWNFGQVWLGANTDEREEVAYVRG